MVTSLSFHSVIAGLTLGLEKEISGVWINFGALALHKFVIAFSVGVELVTSQVSFFLHIVGRCQKFDFKVKFLHQKSSESFSVLYIFSTTGYKSPIPGINYNIFLGTSPWYWNWHLPFGEQKRG